MFSIQTHCLDCADIKPSLNEEIWALYGQAHTIAFEQFSERWQRLDQVVLFRQRASGRLIGCIGVRFHDFLIAGSRPMPTLYFGQVYIEPAFRGRMLIQRTVLGFMLKAKCRHPLGTCYFWTDALTYKPYLVMANNLADYYPHPDRATPPDILALQDAIGARYYPDTFQAETRTVNKPSNLLNDQSVVITERDLQNRFIGFYAQRNPGHAKGDGLLLVCPMSLKNVLHFLLRLIRKKRQSRGRHAG